MNVSELQDCITGDMTEMRVPAGAPVLVADSIWGVPRAATAFIIPNAVHGSALLICPTGNQDGGAPPEDRPDPLDLPTLERLSEPAEERR